MKKGRPTITDVARAAGVSVGTVSNFLNGTVPVKPATAEKIQATIQKLAYRPSVFARSLPLLSAQTTRAAEGNPRLLVVGHICVDYLCRVPVLPHRDDRVAASHIDKALGGPAANLAVAAAAVGAPFLLQVDLATAVGDDADSEWAMAELLSHGVNVLPIRRPAKNRLPRAMVIIEANGGRTIIHETFELSEIDLTTNMDITPSEVRSCLHIEGFHYERMMASIGRFHDAGWTVSLHAAGLPEASRNPAAFERLIAQVDLTFINDEIFREIYSIRTPLASMIDEAARLIMRVKRRGDVVLTIGEFGAVVFRKSGGPPIEVPALPVSRVDATGAGDAFAGIFLSLWLHGRPLVDAARYAAVGASLTTTAEGAQSRTSTAAELEAFLSAVEAKAG
ncbi:PfkB domain-containing protein [Agrobacterium albertimagni AOL15]|jgi:ribokinase|uniref:PfkB domain-containing protein n=1 Tax=Agrobacterium albertimagni AOL15 TaxID=1156935 RepID=K2QFM2_9HYPH|nr:PfkB family carbohydrate kinase [Agrobacterium albertimagni]EKF59851.1 PfkB domain-containing protein [Agrobacterium albertimagni AOL15]